MDKEETEIITEIKKKKELSGLEDHFITQELNLFFKRNPGFKIFLAKPRSEKYKKIIKAVRAELRRNYGLFRVGDDKARDKLVEEFKSRHNIETIKKILATHSSTKERLDKYAEIYHQIFKITGSPKVILDLGCGINPLSVIFMKITKLTYYAYDINQKEIVLLNLFFQAFRTPNKEINGKADILDFKELNNLRSLPKADVAFLFKITDIVDKGKGHKRSESLMTKIPSKYIVVSFPTVTMSGKRMNFPRRKWIELMCIRLGYEFKSFETSKEIFYVIRK